MTKTSWPLFHSDKNNLLHFIALRSLKLFSLLSDHSRMIGMLLFPLTIQRKYCLSWDKIITGH